jgi:DNA-binding response OmpR family regulator
MISQLRLHLEGSMPKILIITADALGSHLLDALLSLHGYDVLFAECGRKGLELFRSTSPDVVVLDLNITDMKSLTVVRQLHRLHSHQPVIVLAGDGTAESKDQMRAFGVNEVISKGLVSRRIVCVLKCLLKDSVPSKGRDLQLTHGGWRTIS